MPTATTASVCELTNDDGASAWQGVGDAIDPPDGSEWLSFDRVTARRGYHRRLGRAQSPRAAGLDGRRKSRDSTADADHVRGKRLPHYRQHRFGGPAGPVHDARSETELAITDIDIQHQHGDRSDDNGFRPEYRHRTHLPNTTSMLACAPTRMTSPASDHEERERGRSPRPSYVDGHRSRASSVDSRPMQVP